MKKSKMLALVMVVTLLVSCFVGCGDDKGDTSNDTNESANQTKSEDENSELESPGVEVGEYIKFGKYEQDNDESNGKEDVEWLVLDKQDNKVLVVSKYALDCKKYNEEFEDVTWESCTIRTWLNNTFFNEVFSAEEKTMVPATTIINSDNVKTGIDGGNDTQDKVFLLSIDEVNKYFKLDDNGKCLPTKYAEAQGVAVDEDNNTGLCIWWLRSPGRSQQDADVFLLDNYEESGRGCDVNQKVVAVRPALWINLE